MATPTVAHGFAVDDVVRVDGDKPPTPLWRITEIVTDDPEHDGPFARLAAVDDSADSWSALRILSPATPDPWAVLAAEMHAIGTDLAALAGSGLPVPSYVSLNIQPGDHTDGASVARVTDAMAQVLMDRDGELREMSNGAYHYDAEERRGPVSVHLYNSVPVEWVERQKHAAELAAMREQLATAEADAARLRAELAKRDGEYAPEGRATAVAPAKPDTYGEPLGHHGKGEVRLPGETSCLHILPTGMRCDEPIVQEIPTGDWIHKFAPGAHDHAAVHHETPTT